MYAALCLYDVSLRDDHLTFFILLMMWLGVNKKFEFIKCQSAKPFGDKPEYVITLFDKKKE